MTVSTSGSGAKNASPKANADFSIFAAAAECPGATFLVCHDRHLSFERCAQETRKALTWLVSSGLKPGQETPVALTAHNDLTTVITLLALMHLRIPAFLLHPAWTQSERAMALTAGDTTSAPHLLRPPANLFELKPITETPSHLARPESVLAIVHTSGSSGRPKGVLLSARAFIASARANETNIGSLRADRWLLSLSLSHIGGLSILTRCLLGRAAVVIPECSTGAGWSAEQTLRQVLSLNVTLLSLVPTQLRALLKLSAECPASLRAVILGGAATPNDLLAQASAAHWPILTSYGSTETCSQVFTQPYRLRGRPGKGVGRALYGVELRLQDARIEIRSPALLSGYYPASPKCTGDTWWATRDLGRLDDEGNLHVLARIDNIIISGGENILPTEVETALLTHSEVEQACVYGRYDDRWGQVVCAVIVTTSGAVPADIQTQIRQKLAAFKCPKRIRALVELPLTAGGKVDRKKLSAGWFE